MDNSTDDPVATRARDDESATEAVVRAVSNAKDEPVEAVPPLTEVVDPDALDSLVDETFTGAVSFPYHDYQVVVVADGGVELY